MDLEEIQKQEKSEIAIQYESDIKPEDLPF